jgi:hypothetical protein
MSKLGYTWYPKDWTNSEAVFQLTLQQRGLYRELIDLAMLNDNKTTVNKSVWSRKFAIKEQDLDKELKALLELKLIEIKRDKLFIPSCESRLNLSRGGSKGGKKSKPSGKPSGKPTPKPTPNQIEIENKDKVNIKETFIFKDEYLKNETLVNAIKTQLRINDIDFMRLIDLFALDYLDPLSEEKFKKAKSHFKNWLKYQEWDKVETEEEKIARKKADADSF